MSLLPILDDLDDAIDRRVASIREGRDWPCARGCDDCCRSLSQVPQLTEGEWRRIDDALTTEARAWVDDNLRTRSARVCPFLDEAEGACTIYRVRPIACRTYGYYVERDGGLWCERIEYAVEHEGLGEGAVFGRHEVVTDRLGPTKPLTTWWRGSSEP